MKISYINKKYYSIAGSPALRVLTQLIIFHSVVILIGCGGSDPQPQEDSPPENVVEFTDAQYKNADVIIGGLEERDIASVIKINGKIDVPPPNMIAVSAPLGGYLKQTHLLPGMFVRKGQILGTLEDQQYVQLQQDYLLAKSKWQLAEQDYKRQSELNLSQASSDKVMQQARTESNNQRILMRSLAEQLRLININPDRLNSGNISRSTQIYSPISGYVSRVNQNIGKYVGPVETLFELINPNNIHLNLKVFERDAPRLAIGQDLTAFTNNNPNKRYPCKIELISKDVSPAGTIDVHCRFAKYDPSLLPGMYMNAEVELDKKTVNSLQEAAIVSFGGKLYIFEVIGNRKFEMKEVQTGMNENGYVAILNDSLFQNKKIVIQGAYALLMKLKNKEE